jgi:hypothetical protein
VRIDAAEAENDRSWCGRGLHEIRRQGHQLHAIGDGFDDEPVEIDVGRDVDDRVQARLHGP